MGMLSTKDDAALPIIYDVYLVFYLKIINTTMLPPIIISVVISKFFTESIRFEMFVPISVVGLFPGG